MALSLGDIAIGAEGLYLGDILIGADNMQQNVIPAPNTLFVEFIVVGGGGGGGFRGTGGGGDLLRGGGGGGGGIATGSLTLTIGVSSGFAITSGLGGVGDPSDSVDTSTGDNSELTDGVNYFYGQGGGGGGTNGGGGGDQEGKSGGSGGGGLTIRTSGGTTIVAADGGASSQFSTYGYGFGQLGCDGGSLNGGSGGTSGTITNTNCPNQLTPGYEWLDGNQYGIGGSSVTTSAQTTGLGFGGNCNNDGSEGVVIVRYQGTTQRADGGTVTTAGGYTYHTFYTAGGVNYFENIR